MTLFRCTASNEANKVKEFLVEAPKQEQAEEIAMTMLPAGYELEDKTKVLPKPFLFIRDDMGELWTLHKGAITMVILQDDPESGYPAQDWEHAIQTLIDYGYLSIEGN